MPKVKKLLLVESFFVDLGFVRSIFKKVLNEAQNTLSTKMYLLTLNGDTFINGRFLEKGINVL